MVERIKKARLIYNPTSGQEIIKKNIAEVLDVLEDVGYETSAYQTTPEPFSAQNEAERAAKAGFDLIIAAGGDGTINEVVNGVAGLENRPQMAFIPTGTTNDYARALKILWRLLALSKRIKPFKWTLVVPMAASISSTLLQQEP